VEWAIDDNGLRITPPLDLGASRHAWAFEILTTKNQHTPADLGNALQEKRQSAIHSKDSTDYSDEKKK
jgi:alpha-L-fucosidase